MPVFASLYIGAIKRTELTRLIPFSTWGEGGA